MAGCSAAPLSHWDKKAVVACRGQSYVADNGCLHIIADRHSIQGAVASLDLDRARLLTRLSLFWVRRVRWVTGMHRSAYCCCVPSASAGQAGSARHISLQ